jgi:hypothetical protein
MFVLFSVKSRPLPAPVYANAASQTQSQSQNITSSANALQQQDNQKANTRVQPPAGIMQGQGKSVAWVK